MRGKKWLLTVVCALLLVGVVCVLGNWLIDPFGVFEASPLQWDSYAQTLNPRGSKVRYISERPGEYDSFVVGSSSAASYLPETLERYYGGSFYNMFHYGADTDYDRELVRYLLEQGEVKRIVLVLGLSDAYALHSKTEGLTAVPDYRVSGENEAAYKLRFLFASPSFAMEKLSSLRKDIEMPQTFDVFLPGTGPMTNGCATWNPSAACRTILRSTVRTTFQRRPIQRSLTSSAVPGMSPRSAKCAAKRGRS